MTETIRIIVSIVSAIGVMAGILAWWIGKLLADKKDSITHTVDIDYIKKELMEIKVDLKELTKDFNDYKNT